MSHVAASGLLLPGIVLVPLALWVLIDVGVPSFWSLHALDFSMFEQSHQPIYRSALAKSKEDKEQPCVTAHRRLGSFAGRSV